LALSRRRRDFLSGDRYGAPHVRTTGFLVGLAMLALLTAGCGATTREVTTHAASPEQRADNQNALNNEAATLSTDVFNLRGELATLAGDVPAGAPILARERIRLRTAHRDLELASSTTADRICAAAATTRHDADGLQGDIDALQGAEETFAGDAQPVLFAVGALRADNDQFRHDLAVVRNYVPAGAPSAAAVASSLASARAAVARGQSALAADLNTANHLLAQANGYAARAGTTCRKRGQ
jgi:hypothetical protein